MQIGPPLLTSSVYPSGVAVVIIPQRDRAAPTAHILDHDRLTDLARHRLGNHPSQRVGRTTGRKRDDELDRPRRVGLRIRHARQRRKAGSACGQVEKHAARKRYRILPGAHQPFNEKLDQSQ